MIALDGQACLNYLFRDYKCHPCVDVCPQEALRLDPLAIESDLCDGCGLCAAVCPTDALSIRPGEILRLIGRASGKNSEDSSLVCAAAEKSERDIEVSCLGMPDCALLLEIMIKKGGDLRLTAGLCSGCEKAPGGDVARRNIAMANHLVSRLGGSERVSLDTAQKTVPGRVYSRRGLFSLAGSKFSGFIAGLSDMERDGTWRRGDIPRKRKRLLDVVAELGKRHTPAPASRPAAADGTTAVHPLFEGKKIDHRCDGCEGLWMCARLCPTGALSLEDDKSGIAILHERGRCIGCRICETTCDRKAISSADAGDCADLSHRESLAGFEAFPCTECGSVTMHRLCSDCASRRDKTAWDIV